jgi:Zn-dependent M28 family amino/carboxypeptidase
MNRIPYTATFNPLALLASALVLAVALAGCSKSEQASEPEFVEPSVQGAAVINEASYREHVKILSSDEFGGRGPASPGEELTLADLVDKFTSLGLAPGNGDSYVQDVPLRSVEVVNKPQLRFSGGSGEDLVLGYGSDQVVFTRRQIPDSNLSASEMIFVGYGINAPERNWNDYAGVDVRGKTVVILVNDPGYATQDPSLFNGNAMTYYGRWTYKYDEAARQGAAGAIIIHDIKPAGYPWSTVKNSWTGPQFDIVRPDAGADLAAVEGWITRENAVALFEKAGLDLEDLYQRAKTPGFLAVPMPTSAATTLENKTGDVVSKNVVALLPGGEASDEVFLYMAHWDHLGTDPSIEGDGIYNGALDNATGTAGLLELAAAFASLPERPRRSVMFVSVTAEEQGLLGSLYYATNPLHPLADTVAGLNMDGLNPFGKTRDVTVVGHGFSELDLILAAAAGEQGRTLAPDPEAEKGYYFRSDHFPLAKLGVPMMYPGQGYDNVEKGPAYGKAMADDYTANRYHRVSDEYSEDWDVTGAIEDLQLYFKAGFDIANDNSWPNWNEGNEFKANRDAQRAGR